MRFILATHLCRERIGGEQDARVRRALRRRELHQIGRARRSDLVRQLGRLNEFVGFALLTCCPLRLDEVCKFDPSPRKDQNVGLKAAVVTFVSLGQQRIDERFSALEIAFAHAVPRERAAKHRRAVDEVGDVGEQPRHNVVALIADEQPCHHLGFAEVVCPPDELASELGEPVRKILLGEVRNEAFQVGGVGRACIGLLEIASLETACPPVEHAFEALSLR